MKGQKLMVALEDTLAGASMLPIIDAKHRLAWDYSGYRVLGRWGSGSLFEIVWARYCGPDRGQAPTGVILHLDGCACGCR